VIVAARAAGSDGRAATAALAETMAALAPDLPLRELGRLTDLQMGASYGRQARLYGSFVLVVGGMALFLALLGIFGVALDSVSRRTREIGLRIVLGAHPRHVVTTLVTESALIAGGGLAAGVLALVACQGAYARMTLVRFGWLGLGPALTDWHVLAPVVTATLALTLLASLLAARRATAIDPASALRTD
jgi:ABC-type antimicrobial peptide transport system permease subunit